MINLLLLSLLKNRVDLVIYCEILKTLFVLSFRAFLRLMLKVFFINTKTTGSNLHRNLDIDITLSLGDANCKL